MDSKTLKWERVNDDEYRFNLLSDHLTLFKEGIFERKEWIVSSSNNIFPSHCIYAGDIVPEQIEYVQRRAIRSVIKTMEDIVDEDVKMLNDLKSYQEQEE